jgi:cupin 2 domain-containing protein
MSDGILAGNLFAALPAAAAEEVFDILVERPALRIERIVSTGQATPPDTWLAQGGAEWVVLLRGAAGLRFEGEAEPRTLHPGDHVTIPPGVRHRVEWTDADAPTVWLAVHMPA